MTSAREVIARANKHPRFSDNWWLTLIYGCGRSYMGDSGAGPETPKFQFDPELFRAALEAEGLVVQTADEVDARIAEAVAGERERVNAALRKIDDHLKYKRAAAISRGAMNEADRLADQMRGVLEAVSAIRKGSDHDG